MLELQTYEPSLFFSYTGFPALSVMSLPSLSVACTGTQYGSAFVAYGFDVIGLPSSPTATPGTLPMRFAFDGPRFEAVLDAALYASGDVADGRGWKYCASALPSLSAKL